MFLSCCGCTVAGVVCVQGVVVSALAVMHAVPARCCLTGNMLVSSCRCCVLVSRIHPVVIRGVVIFTICGLFVFVSNIIGDQC